MGDKTKFVLLQGNHLVSALKALGYKPVNVFVRKCHPAVVDYEHLNTWSKENGGINSPTLLKFLFNILFYGTGLEKAKRKGPFA